MRNFNYLTILLCLFMARLEGIYAQNIQGKYPFYPKTNYVCYKTPEPITVDGKLDEKAWENATWTEEFQDIEGSLKPKPLYSTRVKMLWDDEYLYFAAELEEPHIWATYTERESVIFHENDFEVFIDPDGDSHHYYEYEINALGTDWDLMLVKPYRDGAPAMNSWNINGLKKAVHLYGTINQPDDKDQKWTVELAFPWSTLKEAAPHGQKPKDQDQWRVNFSRVQWQLEVKDGEYVKKINPETNKPYPEFNWVWSPQGVIAMHQPETWGYVQFTDQQVGKEKVEFTVHQDEEIKWLLRQLYFEQRTYKEQHKRYTRHIRRLKSSAFLEPYGLRAKVHKTYHGYEITLMKPDSPQVWQVRADGKIWKSSKK